MENAQELLDESRAELEEEKRVFTARLEVRWCVYIP